MEKEKLNLSEVYSRILSASDMGKEIKPHFRCVMECDLASYKEPEIHRKWNLQDWLNLVRYRKIIT